MSYNLNTLSTNSHLLLNSGYSVTLTAPSLSSSYTLTLPSTAGSSGQVLQTNGSGVTSWTSALVNPASDNSVSIGSSTNRCANVYSVKFLTYNNSTFSSGNVSDMGMTSLSTAKTSSYGAGLGNNNAIYMKGNIAIVPDYTITSTPPDLYFVCSAYPGTFTALSSYTGRTMYNILDIDFNDGILVYGGCNSTNVSTTASYLNILNISNPSSPTLTWSSNITSSAFSCVKLNGNILTTSSPASFSLVSASGTGQISVYDITDTTTPLLINTIAKSSCWHDFYHQTLISIDSSTTNNFSIIQNYLSASPTTASITCYGGIPYRFQIKNGYAYVVGSLSNSPAYNLIVVSLTTYASPVVAYSYQINTYSYINDISIVGDIAYLNTPNGISVITIQNPASISELYSFSLSNLGTATSNIIPKFQIQGRFLYTKPASLTTINTYDMGGIHTTDLEAGMIFTNKLDCDSLSAKKNIDIIGSLTVNRFATFFKNTSIEQLANLTLTYLSITSSYTLTQSNIYVDYNGSTGSTLTVPSSTASNAGKIYFITNSSANSLSLSGTIYQNGSTITTLASLYNISIVSNGNGKWYVF
jgi:hypothetical protein